LRLGIAAQTTAAAKANILKFYSKPILEPAGKRKKAMGEDSERIGAVTRRFGRRINLAQSAANPRTDPNDRTSCLYFRPVLHQSFRSGYRIAPQIAAKC